ncbi:MAG: hypothetical protein EBY43_09355, partial [Opitutae bacterium]|nr:hypothetical protein [Opitutae bacterium]
MHTGKHACFTGNLTQIIGSATISTLSFTEDIIAVDFFLNHFEGHLYMVCVVIFSEFLFACLVGFYLDCIDSHLALLLGISKDRIFHTVTSDFAAKSEHIVRYFYEFKLLLLLSAKSSQLTLGSNDILNRFMGIFKCLNEAVFGDLISGTFDHHHLLLVSDINQIEGGVVHLLIGWVNHKLAVNLPEAHTDFIFSVIGEELGLLGTLAVLALFALLILGIFRVALRADNSFDRYVCAGIGCWFAVQVILNVGTVISVIPVVGVTLPFI